MRRFLFLLILLALLPVAAVAQDVSGADRVTDSQGFSGIGGLFDGKKSQGTKAQDHARLTLEDPEGLRYLYLIFDTEYPGFRVTGEHGEEKEAGQEQFLHTLVDLTALFGEPQKRVTISFDGGPVPLYELYLFTDGELPDWVQQWEAPVEGATDLVLFSTHCDDEQLFFAGVLPYYAGELGYRVEVVYLTNHRNLNNYRCHEALDGLWACGVRQYPVFGGFADYYSRREEDALNQYRIQGVTREDLQGYVVEQLRRFRPLVALGHDLKGEYAHGAHILYATLLTESWEAAGEETAFPESAQRYGTWLTPKLYLHSYEENQIVMDWDQPLKAFGGMTAYEVCKERGFPSHASQVADFAWYMAGMDRAADIPQYSPCYFGLYASTTGPDETGGDFFEHLTDYAQQEKEAEQARRESEEAAQREAQAAREAAQTDPETIPESTPEPAPQPDTLTAPYGLLAVPLALVAGTLLLLRKKS